MTLLDARPHNHPFHRPAAVAAAGIAWLVLAAAFGYLTLATPLVRWLLLLSASSPALVRIVALACVATIPLGWAVAGLCRLVTAARLAGLARNLAARAAAEPRFDPAVRVVRGVRLPTGPIASEVLVAPQGVLVVRELGAAAYRTTSGSWMVARGGGWLPCENPLAETLRDAAAIRRMLTASDLDFVARVHPIVATEIPCEPIAGCGIVERTRLAAYLAALPPQRSLTDRRIETIAEVLRSAR